MAKLTFADVRCDDEVPPHLGREAFEFPEAALERLQAEVLLKSVSVHVVLGKADDEDDTLKIDFEDAMGMEWSITANGFDRPKAVAERAYQAWRDAMPHNIVTSGASIPHSTHEQIHAGANPDELGQCEAITFIVVRKGRKLRAKIMVRQDFESGREAYAWSKGAEARLAKEHNTECGTIVCERGRSQGEVQRDLDASLNG